MSIFDPRALFGDKTRLNHIGFCVSVTYFVGNITSYFFSSKSNLLTNPLTLPLQCNVGCLFVVLFYF